MSQFLPETMQSTPQAAAVNFTPPGGDASGDVALMQRVLSVAVQNPSLIPPDFMAYMVDFIQTARLSIPIGQVFGFQNSVTSTVSQAVAEALPQVVTSLSSITGPKDGQQALLRCGASPFAYVLMVYDLSHTQWVSPEFSAGGGAVNLVTSASNIDIGGKAGISWSPVHDAGLTMQLKWSGWRLTDAGTTGANGISLVFGNFASGQTSATMSESSTAGTGSTEAVGVDWTSVTDPGDFNTVAVGLYARRVSGAGATDISAGVVGRFIK